MKATLHANGIAVARRAAADLCGGLDLPLLPEARPGADLLERVHQGLPFPEPGTLLRAADGWVHPGPPTAWELFGVMAVSVGAIPAGAGAPFPDITQVSAELIDREAGDWRLPAVAVRSGPATPDPYVRHPRSSDVRSASVVVIGTAWAVPLTGLVLAQLGAHVVRIENPHRADPFPLRDVLARGQARVTLDFDAPAGLDKLVAHLAAADLLVDGNTPRVLANLGLDDAALLTLNPGLAVVRVSAFAGENRPGYGLAAECRGGWARRFGEPRLGRTSVADPIAGLLAAAAGVNVLARPGSRARLSLEGAVGHLLEADSRHG